MGLPELFSVESRFRRHMLRAELDFVTALAADIATEHLRRHGPLAPAARAARPRACPGSEMLADPVAHLGEEAARSRPSRGRAGR